MLLSPQINKSIAETILVKKENVFQLKRTLCSSELIYLPYYLFSVSITMKNGKEEKSHVCVDVITGECAHYKVASNNSLSESNNNLIPLISGDEAKEKVRSFILNEILHKKRKRIEFLSIETELKYVLNYPYWIGYFKKGEAIDFKVIDGISGQIQGPKMKPAFIKYLMRCNFLKVN